MARLNLLCDGQTTSLDKIEELDRREAVVVLPPNLVKSWIPSKKNEQGQIVGDWSNRWRVWFSLAVRIMLEKTRLQRKVFSPERNKVEDTYFLYKCMEYLPLCV